MNKAEIKQRLGLPTIEEQFTGCVGAHSYRDFAHKRGYTHIEVLDWTSSAGDWQFIISKDGRRWHVLYQENRYPHHGFSHSIESRTYHGTAAEVLEELYTEYN